MTPLTLVSFGLMVSLKLFLLEHENKAKRCSCLLLITGRFILDGRQSRSHQLLERCRDDQSSRSIERRLCMDDGQSPLFLSSPASSVAHPKCRLQVNCLVSAGYVLAMRKRIKVTNFKDWDSMFYNNLLSIPVLVTFSLLVENWSYESLALNL